MTLVVTPEPRTADWRALGVSIRLVVTEPAELAPARAILTEELARIDLACSRFRPDAEISCFDRADGQPVPVSPLLLEAIEAGLRAARLTGGLVDPTLGQALAAAGYDRDFAELVPCSPGVIVSRMPSGCWDRIRLDRSAGTASVPPGVRLDLGATAKALAADRAARAIALACGGGVLVGLGGDIAVAGRRPAGGWRIRVQDVTGDPVGDPTGPTATITVLSGGLATSSTAARRWCRDGQWMHHILDPLTGVPADSPWRTVSVAAASCLDANIASTACILLGWAAPAWLMARGLPARLVELDDTVHTTAGWPSDAAA